MVLASRRWLWAGWAAALACAAALSVLNLWWGDLNQDEGWYLYAAKQVDLGRLPYRDFAFTQGPVLPLVYALGAGFIRQYGILAGRVFTLALGWMAALLTAALVGKVSRPGGRAVAALLAFSLVACNVYQSYFTTVVKTYSLTAVLVMLGLFSLTFAGGARGAWGAFLSGIFLGLAAGVRWSAGAVLPVAGVYLLVHRRRIGGARWLMFGLGGILGLLVWAGPFAWMAPEGFRFALFEYHTGRTAGSLLGAVIYKAGFISRMVQAYFVGALAMLALSALRVLRIGSPGAWPEGNAPPHFTAMLWWVVGAVTATHFAAPFPYEDYQVFVWPVAAAAISVSAVGFLQALTSVETEGSSRGAAPWGTWFMIVVLLANIAGAFSSPINQDWFVRGRDRIWWPLKEQSPIKLLRDVAAGLTEFAWLNNELLTQDVYLAVEADMAIPPGMELGPFCYFPDLDRQRAERLHVLNREMLRDVLATSRAAVAAFSGYGLAIRCPEVAPLPEVEQKELRALLEERYQLLCEVPYFGQGHTTLRVYVQRRRRP